MAGRPKKLISEEDIKKVEAMAGYGLNSHQIAAILGIGYVAFYKRVNEMPELKQALKTGRAKALVNVAKTAYDLAVSGKVPAMTMFYLKCRGGWREKDRMEVTGKNGKPIQNKMELTITDYRTPDPDAN